MLAWVDQLVCPPSGVHLERGHRYGMHTSPGGRGCHCGTCPLHSQLASTAQIYLHSLLFSRELNCKQQRIRLCFLEVCPPVVYYCHLSFKKQCYYTASLFLYDFSGITFLKPAAARRSFSLTEAHAQEILQQCLLKSTTTFCTVMFLFGHSPMYLCYFSCYIYGYLSANLIALTPVCFFGKPHASRIT